MPGPIDLFYTTIGGVIGAGLTQYVTHLRDRRAARALVIERLADVEEAFTALRLALSEDGPAQTESLVATKLAALEAVSLIAGIPRSVLACYTETVKYYENAHRISQTVVFIGVQTAQSINDNIAELREIHDRDSIVATLKTISESIETLYGQVKATEGPAFRIHDAALHLLSRALWHPVILQLDRRKLRALKKNANRLEETSRRLAGTLRSIESAHKKASSIASILIAAESARLVNTASDRAKAATEQK